MPAITRLNYTRNHTLMKIAISGKGGVGKTLLAAHLALAFKKAGYSVIAIDADPDTNLASTLNFPDAEKIVPISEMKELVDERTGAAGGFFKLNPRVDDIPEKYSSQHEGIRLLVMGGLRKGGSGCYCGENSLLSSLLAHLLIARDEVVIMDMSAGIEHLSRGTARSVDSLLMVIEPGRASLETARRIEKLAAELGIKKIAAVGNKIHDVGEEKYIKESLKGVEVLGFIPYDEALTKAELEGRPAISATPAIAKEAASICIKLAAETGLA